MKCKNSNFSAGGEEGLGLLQKIADGGVRTEP